MLILVLDKVKVGTVIPKMLAICSVLETGIGRQLSGTFCWLMAVITLKATLTSISRNATH